MKNLTTRIVFEGVDKVSKTIAAVSNRVTGAAKKLDGIGRNLRSSALNAGLVSIPASLGLRQASEDFSNFNTAITEAGAIADATEGQLAKLRNQAMKLAATTPFDPISIVKAQKEIIKAGNDLETTISFVPQVAELAIISKQSLPQVADQVTNILSATFGKLTSDELGKKAKRLNDIIVATFTASNQTATEATNASERFSPIARVANLALEDSAALFASLAPAGFKGREAANALRTIMLRLNAPTKAARQAFADLNIDLDKFRKAAAKPITSNGVLQAFREGGASQLDDQVKRATEILNDTDLGGQERIDKVIKLAPSLDPDSETKLREALQSLVQSASGDLDELALFRKLNETGITPAQVDKIFGKQRAAQGAALVANADLTKSFRLDLLEKAAGRTSKLVQKFLATYATALERISSASQRLRISLIEKNEKFLIRSFDRISSAINRMADAFESNPALAKATLMFGGIAVAATPLLIALGLMASGAAVLVKGLGLLLTPLRLVGKALLFLTPALKGSAKVMGFARSALLRLGGAAAIMAGSFTVLRAAWADIKAAFAGFNIGAVVTQLGNTIKALSVGDYQRAGVELRRALFQIETAFLEAGSAIAKASRKLFDEAFPNLGPLIDGFAAGFNFGGILDESTKLGTAVDNIVNAVKRISQAFTVDAATDEQTQRWQQILKDIGGSFGRFTGLALETGIDALATAINGLTTALNVLADAGSRFLKLDLSSGLDKLANGAADGIVGTAKLIDRTAGRIAEQFGLKEEGTGKDGVLFDQRSDKQKKIDSDAVKAVGAKFRDAFNIDVGPQPQIPEKLSQPKFPVIQNVPAVKAPAANNNVRERLTSGPGAVGVRFNRTSSEIQSLPEIRAQRQATERAATATEQTTAATDRTTDAVNSQTAVLQRIASATESIPGALSAAVASNRATATPRPAPISSTGLQLP